MAKDPKRLRSMLGPDLWLLGRTPVKLPGMASQEVAVNLNTAEFEQLRTLPGIDAETAERALRSRREQGAFVDIADFARRGGLDAGKLATLEASAEALRKQGPNARR